ncbi:TBPIP-domain-containing protein [Microthyrium microscopicum]|uniref:TBPIP-domain-containing protein n=1 Tax=Microthyrium microscopicum TaxID=703497 RepID=A0A6A6TZ31_9PEZI|nr:TBPIP-domain-containing protein [Microthyrium microscopicum]
MAPRKEKEKTEKVTGDAAVDTVLRYLIKQNRPYSATDISANLHNKVTKAAAAKILKDLHDKAQIEGRASGKQLVYHALQDASAAPSTEEIDAMAAETLRLRTDLAAQQSTLKQLKAQLASLSNSLTLSDLQHANESLVSQQAELLARLGPLRAGEAAPVSKEERLAVQAEMKRWGGVVKRRKRIVKEIWGVVAETAGQEEGVDLVELKEALGVTA